MKETKNSIIELKINFNLRDELLDSIKQLRAIATLESAKREVKCIESILKDPERIKKLKDVKVLIERLNELEKVLD
jgi:AAA+ superfamily predicted ATPase